MSHTIAVFSLQSAEQPVVLPFNDFPPVVVVKEAPTVPTKIVPETSVCSEHCQGFAELIVVRVVQTGIRPQTLTAQNITPTVHQNRLTSRPGLESDHGQAFQLRGHDEKLRARHRPPLLSFG